jgi:hypothetical protein
MPAIIVFNILTTITARSYASTSASSKKQYLQRNALFRFSVSKIVINSLQPNRHEFFFQMQYLYRMLAKATITPLP